MRWRPRQPIGLRALAQLVPEEMRGDLAVVLAALPPAEYEPVGTTGALVQGAEVEIPGRIYNPPLTAQTALTPLSLRQQRIADCIYTRHHDGWVRERSVERLLEAPEPWVAPFIVLLLGEYVIEVILTIQRGLERLTADAVTAVFAQFIAENPGLIQKVEARAVSYWNCYYRADYPDKSAYPATVVLRGLRNHLPRP